VSRLPFRLRLTLAFALAMAVVLAAMGAFLYFRLASSLDESIDEGLQARAAAGAGAVSAPGSEESFAQVLDPDGGVVEATPSIGERPVLDRNELARAVEEGSLTLERSEVPGVDGRVRLLAVPSEGSVVVVGASLEERDEALQGLLGELFVVGPVALVVASLLGYALARSALRPVESMRAEAAAISAGERGRRLPVPPARDELRRLGETLNEMLGSLEGALERERSFVADASHELRTPMARLKAELELALSRPRSGEELERALRSAAVETGRLERLAEDLLVLARSDQGRLPLRRSALSVGRLLTDVAERFRPEAAEANRALEVEAPDGLELVGDAVRLEQALGNLVENSLRHGEGAIRLSALEANGRVELHVVDQGTGFPPEFLAGAFQRFTRADEARSGNGVGLGLAIVDVIARAHAGSAHAANREAGGADVWLSLPSGDPPGARSLDA
jgi:two-component system OmpR family sensor kinase